MRRPIRPAAEQVAAPLRTLALLAVWTLVLASFWGKLPQGAPAPLRRYVGGLWQAVWRWFRPYAATLADPTGFRWLVECGASLLLFGAVPLLVWRALGRSLRDAGIALPNRWGRRALPICLLAVVPFALVLGAVYANALAADPDDARHRWLWKATYACSTIPEHLLIAGIALASFCPGARLPVCRPDDVPRPREPLRLRGRRKRLLSNHGLDEATVPAIVAAGVLFGIVHLGAPPVELATSFPGGMAVAYLTVRAGSVLPGWIAHVWLMLLVELFLLLESS